jgi:hypothetical protein
MKRLWIGLSLLITAVLTAGCDRRDLTYLSDPTRCEMHLLVDWSRFGDVPHGMTLLCYPVDGGSPVQFITADVTDYRLALSEGEYDLLLFNLTPEEYSTINFRGLETFESAEAVAREKSSAAEMVATRNVDRLTHQPEPLGVARLRGVQVTHRTDTLRMTPEDVLYTGHVVVYVHGIHNVSSVSSTLGQLCAGYMLGTGRSSAETVTHELTDWRRAYVEEGNSHYGVFMTDFPSFGLPESWYTETRAATDFYIDFGLVDNKTVNSFYMDVSERITISDSMREFTILLTDEVPEDPLIVIDDVEVETPTEPSGATGGFGVDVDDWGDSEVIDVSL